jgi:hypothetical protein
MVAAGGLKRICQIKLEECATACVVILQSMAWSNHQPNFEKALFMYAFSKLAVSMEHC